MYKAAAVTLAILITAVLLYFAGYNAARKKCGEEWLLAQNAVLETQANMQAEYERALNESRAKQNAILVDFSAATSELDGLRHAVNTGYVPNAECADNSGAAVRELFIECAGEYIQMAKSADQHAADAVACVTAWRAVENAK